MNKKQYEKFCIGCGLCASNGIVEKNIDERGFFLPKIKDIDRLNEFADDVCPASRTSMEQLDASIDVWGKREQVYYGYASDSDIRHKASSGGVLTSVACYLLTSGKVDAILHVGVSDESQIKTKNVCSKTVEEVISYCGSRYTISSPLSDIMQTVEEGKKYAFIGKPCDVTALSNYLKKDEKLNSQIVYLLSFFCAGLPSYDANKTLLDKLGTDEGECKSLVYRGNGWPGKATAINSRDEKSTILYEKAWGGILGRDIHAFCRMCMDGIGERADLSCGDAWFLDENGNPDFTEGEGRNVIFARNIKGLDLLNEIVQAGYIKVQTVENIDDLNKIQKYQLERKSTMYDKFFALKIFGRVTPEYRMKDLYKFAKDYPMKKRFRIFAGTVKRIIKGKM